MLNRLSTETISSPQLRTSIPEKVNHSTKHEVEKKLEQTLKEELKKTEQTPKEEEKNKNNQQEVSKDKVKEMVEGLNKFLEPTNTSVHFEYHEKLDEYYVKLIDQKTDEIIKEIPSKKLMDVYATMLEFVGIMVDKKI